MRMFRKPMPKILQIDSACQRAFRYSRLSWAIKLTEISLGQTAWHSDWLEQLPKPSLSICAIMRLTRSFASTFPCGRLARCDTLAETKSMAEAFLQAATQAP